MEYSELLYGIWLSQRYPPGDKTPALLLQKLRSPSAVYRAEKHFLMSLGFSAAEIRPLSAKTLDRAQRIAELCAGAGISVISYSDREYPVQLMQLPDPPPVIYCKGTLPDTSAELMITAVGTRRPSDTGRANAHKLCFDLACAGAVIISGMARGIDSECHAGAIDGGGKTIAVAGCGCDVIYPPENSYLYGSIIENGAVISEYPPGTEPLAGNFPVRNRLMAALGAVTVVAEAGIGSGALITAERAASLGRLVYAIGGGLVSASSRGSNLLLKQGAVLCTCAEDVLAEYEGFFPDKIDISRISSVKYIKGDYSPHNEQREDEESPVSLTDENGIRTSRSSGLDGQDRVIYETLFKNGAMTAEELSERGIDMSSALYRLMMLEIKGYVTALPGGKYAAK